MPLDVKEDYVIEIRKEENEDGSRDLCCTWTLAEIVSSPAVFLAEVRCHGRDVRMVLDA